MFDPSEDGIPYEWDWNVGYETLDEDDARISEYEPKRVARLKYEAGLSKRDKEMWSTSSTRNKDMKICSVMIRKVHTLKEGCRNIIRLKALIHSNGREQRRLASAKSKKVVKFKGISFFSKYHNIISR